MDIAVLNRATARFRELLAGSAFSSRRSSRTAEARALRHHLREHLGTYLYGGAIVMTGAALPLMSYQRGWGSGGYVLGSLLVALGIALVTARLHRHDATEEACEACGGWRLAGTTDCPDCLAVARTVPEPGRFEIAHER
ncbi:MAG: hypothetical protein R3B72_08520 [Polyangiaceae bacterium]